MFRALKHAVDCLNPECEQCEQLDQQLEDGPQHYPPDPMARSQLLDNALVELRAQSSRLERYIESAPVPPSVIRCAMSLTENIDRARGLFRSPVLRAKPARKPAVVHLAKR